MDADKRQWNVVFAALHGLEFGFPFFYVIDNKRLYWLRFVFLVWLRTSAARIPRYADLLTSMA
jgi:hypothetical protein